MAKSPVKSGEGAPAPGAQKLLVSGLVLLRGSTAPVELRRLMRVESAAGEAVGMVAAVALDGPRQEITHFLLGCVPPTAVYRLVALDLIEAVEGDRVRLRLGSTRIEELPIHRLA